MDSPKALLESASLPSFASAQPVGESRQLIGKGGPWVNRRDHLVSVGKTVAQPPLNEAAAVAWKARRKVGGVGKGGLLVRSGEQLTSEALPHRLATGSWIQEIERKGQRLHFRLFAGLGPWEGWISVTLHGSRALAEEVEVVTNHSDRPVLVDLGQHRWFRCWAPVTTTWAQLKERLRNDDLWPQELILDSGAEDAVVSEGPHHLRVSLRRCLRPEASAPDGNAALRALAPGAPGRAAVLWRWQRLEMALEEMEKAADLRGLLALQVVLGRWPDAHHLAKQLHSEEAEGLVASWRFSSDPGRFSPSPCLYEESSFEVMPGVRQIDGLIPVEEVKIGIRLFLQVRADHPQVSRPLVLYFHGNAETVDTYTDPEVFQPLQASQVSALVVDFRGYGFSTGHPSLATLHTDGERVVDALPTFLTDQQLPWPWPGGLYLLGRSMGGLVACHLAALKGGLFEGLILESTFCGSYAPGALPPEEPPQEGGPLGSVAPRFWSGELQAAVEKTTELCRKLMKPTMEELGAEDLDSFVHLMASEDKLRAFAGRILHGEIDTIIPVSHARRLCDAACFATRRLVTVNKGHNDISNSEKYVAALKKFLNGG